MFLNILFSSYIFYKKITLTHCTENSIYVFPEMKLCDLPIPTFLYLWAIYIFPGSVCLFGCSKIGRPFLGIYKSLTDTWMWNWETEQYNYVFEITRPSVSFLGIHKSDQTLTEARGWGGRGGADVALYQRMIETNIWRIALLSHHCSSEATMFDLREVIVSRDSPPRIKLGT